jgi:hypothetical protein
VNFEDLHDTDILTQKGLFGLSRRATPSIDGCDIEGGIINGCGGDSGLKETEEDGGKRGVVVRWWRRGNGYWNGFGVALALGWFGRATGHARRWWGNVL